MTKKLLSISIFLLLGIVAIIWIANRQIEKSTNKLIYKDLNEIPYTKVGLLLGTSKYLKSGQPNQYFINRINATADLYNAKKIDFIVVSGDNTKKSYNEPEEMKTELLKSGIPENKIYLDYAGFRTYDSVIRINKIFGQRRFTIISQDFHNRRAIYIALHLHLEGIGYDAKDVDFYNGFKTKLREKFARVKMFVDFVTQKKPKFLGPQIDIK
jgi:SanA protein